ncbi:hypothetical protein ZIOFF_074528 (mitochondrion) [Zingiber officinale]|uniref:Uncharacterized protein n=1 Tax=Zingiber officinale TaxID=94328 RepID=A0A8J5BV29_ZINOF|nr:hypothetical protein ZIOFF_074528 [Zingiber officinale]
MNRGEPSDDPSKIRGEILSSGDPFTLPRTDTCTECSYGKVHSWVWNLGRRAQYHERRDLLLYRKAAAAGTSGARSRDGALKASVRDEVETGRPKDPKHRHRTLVQCIPRGPMKVGMDLSMNSVGSSGLPRAPCRVAAALARFRESAESGNDSIAALYQRISTVSRIPDPCDWRVLRMIIEGGLSSSELFRYLHTDYLYYLTTNSNARSKPLFRRDARTPLAEAVGIPLAASPRCSAGPKKVALLYVVPHLRTERSTQNISHWWGIPRPIPMHDPPYNASHDHPGRFTRDLMTSTGILAWQRPTPQSIHELVPRRLIQFSLRCLDRIPHTEEADRRWITIIVIGHALIRIHGSRRRKTQPILSNSPLR